MTVVATSEWFGTDPIGGPVGQGDFLNGAAIVETSLEPTELLQHLRGIESSLGRQRRIRWDARTIDVDILLFDDICMETDVLTVPHPRMICRRFVLEAGSRNRLQLDAPRSTMDHRSTARPPRLKTAAFRLDRRRVVRIT